jgi:hypothetical protein
MRCSRTIIVKKSKLSKQGVQRDPDFKYLDARSLRSQQDDRMILSQSGDEARLPL